MRGKGEVSLESKRLGSRFSSVPSRLCVSVKADCPLWAQLLSTASKAALYGAIGTVCVRLMRAPHHTLYLLNSRSLFLHPSACTRKSGLPFQLTILASPLHLLLTQPLRLQTLAPPLLPRPQPLACPSAHSIYPETASNPFKYNQIRVFLEKPLRESPCTWIKARAPSTDLAEPV